VNHDLLPNRTGKVRLDEHPAERDVSRGAFHAHGQVLVLGRERSQAARYGTAPLWHVQPVSPAAQGSVPKEHGTPLQQLELVVHSCP